MFEEERREVVMVLVFINEVLTIIINVSWFLVLMWVK